MTTEHEQSHWCCEQVEQSALLVDGEDYFRALYKAASAAQHSILIAGWQFDPHVELLRGDEADAAELPVALWDFLNALCEARPELKVYVLAWDYSLVYAFERDWMQMAQARLAAHRRIEFRWREHPDPLGSHHQKMVIVDHTVAFAGGLDLGMARWDTREHLPYDVRRQDGTLTRQKPFHDVQAAVAGPAVQRLEQLFWEAWNQAGGSRGRANGTVVSFPAEPEPGLRLDRVCGSHALYLKAQRVALSRTAPPTHHQSAVCETLAMYERLIDSAQRLIYIETQYLTSSAISRALLVRMSQTDRPSLAIVLVMPNGADSPKEQLVLGKRQRQVLSAVTSAAQRFGHEFRILQSAARDKHGQWVATYIHSKLMIVDDEALLVGSANLTNRSMGLDTELVLTFNADRSEQLGDSIARARASLLAEHAGLETSEALLELDGLVGYLDELCAGDSKLIRHEVTPCDEADPLIGALFDPSTTLQHQDWDRIWEQVLGLNEEGVVKRSWEAIKALLTPSTPDSESASQN